MIATLHEKRCLDVLHASSVRDFKRQIVDFAQNLGFDTVGALVVVEHSPTMVEFQSVTNAPAAYLDEFHDLAHGDLDPVGQHCARSSTAIVWDRRTYVEHDVDALWEIQAPFGYQSGIAVAMHVGRGLHFMFGANWSVDRCARVPNFKAIAEDLLSFGEHAQAAAFELTIPLTAEPDSSSLLTRRELEALRWTMDGMSSWEIGRRMAVSSCDVTLSLRRAMQKLECGSKYEAVLKAIKWGLIQAT